jgi:hypothetical protein
VSRDGKWSPAALVVVLVLAALLGGCGDSDSNGSGETASTSTTTAQNGDENRDGGGSGDKAPGRDKPQDQARSQDQGDDSPPKNVVATPLKVSGGGSEQFRVKGGDNSVQEFGEESDESELQEVAELVHDFYVARASGAWSEACSYLSAGLREQFEELASKSKSKLEGCAPFLEAFTTDLPASVWREITEMDAASLRQEDEQAFLLYRGAKDVTYAMPLFEEDGEWKITAISASALS